MHRPLAFALTLALGCRSALRPTTPTAPAPAPTAALGATMSTGVQSPLPTVRAREAVRMPRCTADDALATGSLAEGIAATPALARREDGGLVVYIHDHDRDGRADLGFLALNPQGAPAERGDFTLTEAGEDPAFPALAATDTGYLLVWRRGSAGHHTLASRVFDAHGAPRGPVTELRNPQGSLGAPALLWVQGASVVAVARGASGELSGTSEPLLTTHVDVLEGSRPLRTIAAPEGTRFDGAPVMVSTPTGLKVFGMLSRANPAAHSERALLQLVGAQGEPPGAPPTLIARDMDHPAAMSTRAGVLMAWRARVARRDSALRSVLMPEGAQVGSPPVTLATFRGAYGVEVALAALGPRWVGALSVSTLGDGAAGSLNLSLLDDRGEYIGRAPILTGFLTRSARLSVASRGADAWVAIDGRDTDGTGPELLITHLRCDETSEVARLDVPPATFVQDLGEPDPAVISLARTPGGGGAAMSCTTRGAGGFVTHQGDGLSDSSAAVVHLGPRALLLSVARLGAGSASLSYTWIDARGRAQPARRALDAAEEILAAEPVSQGALAVVRVVIRDVGRAELVSFRPAGVSRGAIPSGMRDPSSAVVVPETGTVWVTARTEAGAPWLFRVSTHQEPSGVPVPIAPLRLGDRVLDALHRGASTEVLLSRPDALDPEVGQSLARLTVSDGAAPGRPRDPFTDPIGHPRGAVLWATRGLSPAVMYSEREVIREGVIEGGQITRARSVMALLPGGGRVLARQWVGAERWVALATGRLAEGSAGARDTRAITLAVLGADGAVRAVNSRVPDDSGAVNEAAAMAVSGRRVVLLYPRVSGPSAIEWAYSDLDCGGVQ